MTYPIPTAPITSGQEREQKARFPGWYVFKIPGKREFFGMERHRMHYGIPAFIVPNNTDRPSYTDVLKFFFEDDASPLAYRLAAARVVKELAIYAPDSISHQIKVIFGNYRESRKGRQIFELNAPERAKHLLLRAPAEFRPYEENFIAGVLSFTNFVDGYEYWILPVGGKMIGGDEDPDDERRFLCTLPQVVAMRQLGSQLYEAIP